MLRYSLFLRSSICRTQQRHSSLGKGAQTHPDKEEQNHIFCALYRGKIPISLYFKRIKKIGNTADNVTVALDFQVQTPSGTARTHRFATETAELPAQEGERVTIASAAPSDVYRQVGPFKFTPKSPNLYPGEPMSLTNHKDGRESLLLRPPSKEGDKSLQPAFLIPLLAVLATGDAASGMIDPSLPQLLSVAAVTSLAVGATVNSFVLPQLNQVFVR